LQAGAWIDFPAIWASPLDGFMILFAKSVGFGDRARSVPRDERQNELFRRALETIIDMGHPLVRLASRYFRPKAV
jgi:hypothetical protein